MRSPIRPTARSRRPACSAHCRSSRCSSVRTGRLAATIALGLAVLAPGALAQRLELVDRIVAVVNKEVVRASELRERVAYAESELTREGRPAAEPGLLESQGRGGGCLGTARRQTTTEAGGARADACE